MNSGGASSHAPPSLAARGFTRRREKKAAGELLPSSSLTVTTTSTCNKKRKKGPQTVDFRFVFLCFFRSAFLPTPSSDLLHCGSAVMGFIFFSSASGADRAALQRLSRSRRLAGERRMRGCLGWRQ